VKGLFNRESGRKLKMKAYKLLRVRKNGTIGPLFINRRQIIPTGVWLESEDHPTKGFAHRQGWHCTLKPVAPHLSLKGRCWYEVSIKETMRYKRPESQGGTWVLAQKMKIKRPLK
jgi:hypothetical protein